jgi:hypothetical protein
MGCRRAFTDFLAFNNAANAAIYANMALYEGLLR